MQIIHDSGRLDLACTLFTPPTRRLSMLVEKPRHFQGQRASRLGARRGVVWGQVLAPSTPQASIVSFSPPKLRSCAALQTLELKPAQAASITLPARTEPVLSAMSPSSWAVSADHNYAHLLAGVGEQASQKSCVIIPRTSQGRRECAFEFTCKCSRGNGISCTARNSSHMSGEESSRLKREPY